MAGLVHPEPTATPNACPNRYIRQRRLRRCSRRATMRRCPVPRSPRQLPTLSFRGSGSEGSREAGQQINFTSVTTMTASCYCLAPASATAWPLHLLLPGPCTSYCLAPASATAWPLHPPLPGPCIRYCLAPASATAWPPHLLLPGPCTCYSLAPASATAWPLRLHLRCLLPETLRGPALA